MSIFIKATVSVLIAAIVCISLSKNQKEFSVLVSITISCIVTLAAIGFLEPVIDLVHKLESIAQLDQDMISILLKSVAIGMLSEFTCGICADAGNSSAGKMLKILSSSVILWLSLPLLYSLLDIIDGILVNK